MKKILLTLFFLSIIISLPIQTIFAQGSVLNQNDVLVDLRISPNQVESGHGSHPIGYVSLVNRNGLVINPTNDIHVQLKSDNPEVASVPSQITIKPNQDFAIFDIKVENTEGETTVSATLNGSTVFQKFVVGETISDIPNNAELIIHLPSSEMHVESKMPFSVFLKSGEQIIQAPYDIPITLDYENSLLRLDSGQIVIQKDNYYAWGIINTNDKVGNAFLRAHQKELNLNSAKSIKITSSFPAGLKIDVFPEIVAKEVERDIDVVVSLVDSDGNPTLAQDDVQLKFFSDVEYVGQQIDKKMNESLSDGIIKKGEFNYYFKQRLTLNNIKSEINIGVSAPGLGITSDCFITRIPYTSDNPVAGDKTMHVFTVDKIPSNSKTIAVYQIGALIETVQSDDIDEENSCVDLSLYDQGSLESTSTENGQKIREFRPVLTNENLASTGSYSKINLITSNRLLLNIEDLGKIDSGHSYGTALIKSGKEIGEVSLATTIKGIGSASKKSDVVNTLKHTKSMIFSPIGSGTILFDRNGNFDLFVLSLDAKGRPTFVENEASYLLSPVNALLEIKRDSTFVHSTLHSDSFGSLADGDVTLIATPIGVSANDALKATSKFSKNPTSEVKIILPFKEVNMNSKIPYDGIIQLLDLNGNPIKTTTPIKVKINSTNPEIIQVPRFVEIEKGTSYSIFPIMPKGKTGDVELSAEANGVIGSKNFISSKSFLTKLSISTGFIDEPLPPGESQELKIYVDSDSATPIEGAKLRIVPLSNATITQTNVKTQPDGSAVINFIASNGPKTVFQVIASADGYIEQEKTFEFSVDSFIKEPVRDEILGLPEWTVYVGIAAILVIMAVVVLFLKKPKQKNEDEDEIFEEEI